MALLLTVISRRGRATDFLRGRGNCGHFCTASHSWERVGSLAEA